MKRLVLILLCLIILTSCSANNKKYDSSVVYEIFVGSFYDTDNDGIGDIQGIIKKLDYLKALGIGDIWLTPIHPSVSYHKYDVLDYYSIDESFGTMADFDMLIDEANKKDIGIIIDLVLNHTGVDHPWFIEAKKNILNNSCDSSNKCEYYNFKDTNENNTTKLNNNTYYESVFGSHMPDLNLDNENVRKEIENIIKFYLDKGVKGFRLDAPFHYYGNATKNNEFLSWLNNTIKKYNKDAFIVGEVWSDEKTILSHYESGIDSFFNFTASYTDGKIVSSIRSKRAYDLAEWIYNNNNQIKNINPNAFNSMFLSNHDQGRSAGFFTNNIQQQKLMINTYLLSSGVAYVYYGEEIGMLGSGIDQNKRLAMVWGEDSKDCNNPVGADYNNTFNSNVKIQIKDKNSLLNYYKKVIKIRNNYNIWKYSNLELIDLNDDSIYAIRHYNDDQNIIVVHNYSEEDKNLNIDYKVNKLININGNCSINSKILKMDGLSSVILEIGE